MNESIQTLLYTIASLSASFVAILGGFIASKLLAINGERESIKNQLSKVKCEIILKKAHKGILYDQLNDDDALSFIDDHIEDLVNKTDLNDVYSETEKELLPKELLLPYWEKGLELVTRIETIDSETIDFNDDYVPTEIAVEIKGTHFDYKVCAMIAKEMYHHPFFSAKPLSSGNDNWYEHTSQKFDDLEHEIYSLTLQESLLESQEKELSKPKGMTSGLIVFILFSVFNIICPLILSTIKFPEACTKTVAFIVIGVLALGLATVFLYLINLLKWKKDTDTSCNTDELKDVASTAEKED